MTKSINGTTLIIGVYVITLVLFGVVLVSTISSTHVVWEAEALFGHPLSCWQAYEYRAIDAYFYPDRRFQGDLIYTFSLFSPCIFLTFLALTGTIVATMIRQGVASQVRRFLTMLVSLGGIVFFALLLYMPIIYTISCATE